MTLATWQRLSPQRIIRLDQAIDCYLHRQARRINPDGYFDNGGRWYPSETERQSCCSSIREPSREWRFSLNKHCRSMKHIAHLFDVDLRFLRQRAKELETEFFQTLRARCIAEARERHPRQPGTGPPQPPPLHEIDYDTAMAIGDRPGGNRAKPPARLPFVRQIAQTEVDDLNKLLKEIESLI